jgi:hypothetical protein
MRVFGFADKLIKVEQLYELKSDALEFKQRFDKFSEIEHID